MVILRGLFSSISVWSFGGMSSKRFVFFQWLYGAVLVFAARCGMIQAIFEVVGKKSDLWGYGIIGLVKYYVFCLIWCTLGVLDNIAFSFLKEKTLHFLDVTVSKWILQRVVYRWYFLAVDFESINNIFCRCWFGSYKSQHKIF